MDIFSLKRTDGAKRSEAAAFVVVAESAHEARRLAALSAGSEGAYPWAFEAELVKAGTAEPNVTAGVLLGSFVADYDD
jgi:hypothetical protein